MHSHRAVAARERSLSGPGEAVTLARTPGGGYQPAYGSEIDESEAIRRYIPIVKSVALHLKGRLPASLQLDDLIQAGMIAVLRLMRHDDLAQFGEGALRRSILNAMIDEARRHAWAPVRAIRLAKTAAAAMRSVERRLGRRGSDEELAAEMGISLAEYQSVLMEVAAIRVLNLDELGAGEGERLHARENPETAVHKSRIVAALAQATGSLPEREKLVVSLYYEQELSMEEIGKVLGLDKSTVCRAHGRALLMLRSSLGGGNDDANIAQPGGE